MPGYDDIVNIAGLKSAQIDKPDFPVQPIISLLNFLQQFESKKNYLLFFDWFTLI